MYFYLHKFEENRVMVVHTKLCDVADCFYGFRYIDMRNVCVQIEFNAFSLYETCRLRYCGVDCNDSFKNFVFGTTY